MTWKTTIAVASVLALAACSDSSTPTPTPVPAPSTPATSAAPPTPAPTPASSGPQDGELDFPEGYEGWSVFLTGIEKADTKQIRDIYLNGPAVGAARGLPLPDGSTLVMEIYGATETEGGLEKGALSKIFVMTKNDGWGDGTAIPNGEWVYGAFEADGSPAQVDYATCRSCHLPKATEDFVHRLDEYLDANGK